MLLNIFPRALPLLLAYLSSVSAQDSTCYWRSQNAINPASGWFACNNTQQEEGGAQLCCLPDSQCSDDALCRQGSDTGGYNYFVGGCTDPNYQDSVCRSSCTGDAQTWITWASGLGVWECCGDTGLDGCSDPTGETFIAEAPDEFTAVQSAPTSVSSVPATSSSASTTSTSLPSTTSATSSSSPPPAGTSSSSSGLSTGAKAGIGVGAAVAAIAIGAIIYFCVRHKRKQANKTSQSQATVEEDKRHESMPPRYQSPPASGYYDPGNGQQAVYAKRAPDANAVDAQEMHDQSFLHANTHELPVEGAVGTELSSSKSTRRN